MGTEKKEVIRLLEKIAIYKELKGENPFKIQAFRRAAVVLEQDGRAMEDLTDLTALPGIGKGTASVIEEFLTTGQSSVLENLQKEVPKGLVYLLQIPGLGAKTIAKLNRELQIENVEDLRKACLDGRVRKLRGFGEKKEQKILEAIEQVSNRPSRMPIAFMLPVAQWVENRLAQMEGVVKFSRAGSLRRIKETSKDLDFVIAAENLSEVRDQILQWPNLKEVINLGDTKVTCILSFDVDVSVDFRIVSPDHFPSALHHFTGSKEHNIRMRQIAKERKEKISEYGVERTETGEILTFLSERDFFHHFGLPYLSPELREDGTEIDKVDRLADIVSERDMKGDLHMHTTWSDGGNSIEEMVEACRRRGYEYMAITDHSEYLKVANGLTKDRLLKQMEIIRNLNDKYSDITILSGIELDILPDGSLDLDEDLLSQLDLVIASIHSAFHQNEGMIMQRLASACKNPHVDIIAHPTGRIIGKRDGYPVDIERLIRLAKETNTVLELNASPKRLDLKREFLMKAAEAGVVLIINTDAHNVQELANMEIGVKYARKAWLNKGLFLNTMDFAQLRTFLVGHKKGKCGDKPEKNDRN